METLHKTTEESPKDPFSDLDIWGRLIEYRKEVQWGNILAQVEELESKFDRSKTWEKFVNEPVIDQYGQVWMIWENGDCYQIYKMPDDEDKFDYVFIDDLEVTPTLSEPIYKFSVGFDNFGDAEILNIPMSDKINEYCLLSNHERDRWEMYRRWTKHDNDSYSAMEDLRKNYERYEKMQRKLGNDSFSAEERFREIYDKYGRIQQKLGAVSIRDLAIAA
jgi:hypothetical protein